LNALCPHASVQAASEAKRQKRAAVLTSVSPNGYGWLVRFPGDRMPPTIALPDGRFQERESATS
jgi:hypothetical protein